MKNIPFILLILFITHACTNEKKSKNSPKKKKLELKHNNSIVLEENDSIYIGMYLTPTILNDSLLAINNSYEILVYNYLTGKIYSQVVPEYDYYELWNKIEKKRDEGGILIDLESFKKKSTIKANRINITAFSFKNDTFFIQVTIAQPVKYPNKNNLTVLRQTTSLITCNLEGKQTKVFNRVPCYGNKDTVENFFNSFIIKNSNSYLKALRLTKNWIKPVFSFRENIKQNGEYVSGKIKKVRIPYPEPENLFTNRGTLAYYGGELMDFEDKLYFSNIQAIFQISSDDSKEIYRTKLEMGKDTILYFIRNFGFYKDNNSKTYLLVRETKHSPTIENCDNSNSKKPKTNLSYPKRENYCELGSDLENILIIYNLKDKKKIKQVDFKGVNNFTIKDNFLFFIEQNGEESILHTKNIDSLIAE